MQMTSEILSEQYLDPIPERSATWGIANAFSGQ